MKKYKVYINKVFGLSSQLQCETEVKVGPGTEESVGRFCDLTQEFPRNSSQMSDNNLTLVRELLRSGCDVNYYTRDEHQLLCTYLHLSKDSTITRELLLHGACVDALMVKK